MTFFTTLTWAFIIARFHPYLMNFDIFGLEKSQDKSFWQFSVMYTLQITIQPSSNSPQHQHTNLPALHNQPASPIPTASSST